MNAYEGGSYLDAVNVQVVQHPERIAYENSAGERLSYGELGALSDAWAAWLADPAHIASHAPVVLYGHKSPFMLAGMLACAKSGHAYVPIDTIYPWNRVQGIVEQLVTHGGSTLVINTTESETPSLEGVQTLLARELSSLAEASDAQQIALAPVKADDTFYILFTSGSTGVPKGVEMPTRYVDYFTRWLIQDYRTLATDQEREEGLVWFNRSPFSFDLSTDDLFCGLSCGDRIFALEESAENSFKASFEALSSSGVTDWISTPSFVDACLADPSFSQDLLPRLRRVMLAGETLRKDTVHKLHERFPKAMVLNNYGPTETGTVSICEITDAMLADERSLPIGYLGPEVKGLIVDHDTLQLKAPGEFGELIIVGNVAKGYWGRPDLTQKGFKSCPEELSGGQPSYRTGDACMLDASGLLYYNGRLDNMIKLHGYRIEVGEVESVLSSLAAIDMACVLPLRREDGTVYRLMAVVQPSSSCAERGRALTRSILGQIEDTLPSYMVPGTFRYVESIPLNPNGKADRKALANMMGI